MEIVVMCVSLFESLDGWREFYCMFFSLVTRQKGKEFTANKMEWIEEFSLSWKLSPKCGSTSKI